MAGIAARFWLLFTVLSPDFWSQSPLIAVLGRDVFRPLVSGSLAGSDSIAEMVGAHRNAVGLSRLSVLVVISNAVEECVDSERNDRCGQIPC